MKITNKYYTEEFYRQRVSSVRRSAAPIIRILLQHLKIRSVVDIGCARGEWLAEFVAAGIADVMGLDGPWVPQDALAISTDRFISADLSKPFDLRRQFDFALCLEVAEHLPENAADALVNSLTQLADVILFSAAIPYQPGDNHLNCQWPQYWAEKFASHDFVASDFLRPLIWDQPDIAYHYRQNAILYYKRSQPPADSQIISRAVKIPASLVHPGFYMATIGQMSHDLAVQSTLRYNLQQVASGLLRRLRYTFRLADKAAPSQRTTRTLREDTPGSSAQA